MTVTVYYTFIYIVTTILLRDWSSGKPVYQSLPLSGWPIGTSLTTDLDLFLHQIILPLLYEFTNC